MRAAAFGAAQGGETACCKRGAAFGAALVWLLAFDTVVKAAFGCNKAAARIVASDTWAVVIVRMPRGIVGVAA